MNALRFLDYRNHLDTIRRAALAAADPGRAVLSALALEGNTLQAGSHSLTLHPNARLILVGLGKASPAMCRTAAAVLGERLAEGVAAVPVGYTGIPPARIRYYPSGHPLPDEGSLMAGDAVAKILERTSPNDLVIVLVSGGGSAMLELPQPGISLTDMRSLNLLLLKSGAPIESINTVRMAISRIKAGGLARLSAPARVIALILSDVVGNKLSAIASGPTILRRPPHHAARSVLESHGLWKHTPASVRSVLTAPDPNRSRARRPTNVLVASNRRVVEAAASEARRLGFPTRILTYNMHGEARQVGRDIAAKLMRAPRPGCLMLGGETTVTVLGPGRGGRNQELALAAALQLKDSHPAAILAMATDGIDGPTDAAGAMITNQTMGEAKALGLDPRAALAGNDSYPLLAKLGALIRSGPTGTNLNDLVVGLTYP